MQLCQVLVKLKSMSPFTDSATGIHLGSSYYHIHSSLMTKSTLPPPGKWKSATPAMLLHKSMLHKFVCSSSSVLLQLMHSSVKTRELQSSTVLRNLH